MTHRITIEPIHITETSQRYRVHHDGRVLLESTRVPLLDACRALLAEGISGRVEMWRQGSPHRDAATDIEQGAKWTVTESDKMGPLFSRWQPFARESAEEVFPTEPVGPRTAENDFQVPNPTPDKTPALG